MIFYRFHEAGGPTVVITNDITGANLPKMENVWTADGQTQINEGGGVRLGAHPKEIINAIEREGYFIGFVRRAYPAPRVAR
jgi:hypothetical protein